MQPVEAEALSRTARAPGIGPAADAAVVVCRGVSKRYGERLAVDGLDLAVAPGICFGLLGPNGAGKTTALRMIYGVTRPSAGQVTVFGLDVARDARRVRARLGVTLQENALVETLDARENLRIFARYHRLERADAERRIEELLDFLELRSHASVPVRALSGGFQRRLAIALSLVNRPELLILDEPTTGLDPAVRRALWERVRELRASGTTVLLTTHYMDEAERFLLVLGLLGLAPLPHALWTLPLLPLTGLLFAATGIAFSLRIPSIEPLTFYFTVFLTPLFLFSDVFFPLQERLSGVWLWVAEALPLLHPVRLVRHAFRGDWSPILLWDLAYILAVSALLLALAVRVTRRRLAA